MMHIPPNVNAGQQNIYSFSNVSSHVTSRLYSSYTGNFKTTSSATTFFMTVVVSHSEPLFFFFFFQKYIKLWSLTVSNFHSHNIISFPIYSYHSVMVLCSSSTPFLWYPFYNWVTIFLSYVMPNYEMFRCFFSPCEKFMHFVCVY